jgi:hypothetical protein
MVYPSYSVFTHKTTTHPTCLGIPQDAGIVKYIGLTTKFTIVGDIAQEAVKQGERKEKEDFIA